MLELNGGNAGGGDAAAALVKDSSDANFMIDVIDASKTTPVIVDFWAPWCGPCKQLGPALEKAVKEAGGKVRMVKINIDENPMVAGQLQVQSIPTVYAFAGGQPVDGFMGAQPPSQIKAFIERLCAGAPADPREEQINAALDAADGALNEGAAADAAQIYAQILGADPENVRAIAGLARCYAANGDFARARDTLSMAKEDQQGMIAAARAAIDLAEDASGAADGSGLGALKSRLEADANDHQARYDYALGLLAEGRREEAVDALLELFRRDREWNEDAARKQLFKMFDAFGPKDPLTLSGRRRLSSLVFA